MKFRILGMSLFSINNLGISNVCPFLAVGRVDTQKNIKLNAEKELYPKKQKYITYETSWKL